MKLKEAKEDEIYILFIDFSCVYDNVQHEILRIINLIKKVYSYAIITIDPIMKSIIRQYYKGKHYQPYYLINIDDLICTLKNSVHDVLEYADDIAVISKSKKNQIK